jgi:hypothetical protein
MEGSMYNSVLVTTGDLKEDYKIIGPVYFQISNKGILSNQLNRMKNKYKEEIEAMQSQGQIGKPDADWGFLIGEWSVGQSDFELAFYIAVQELKKRALSLGGDAIIFLRQDIDLDTNAFAYFYLQMYGTAVVSTQLNEEEHDPGRNAIEVQARIKTLLESSKSLSGDFRIAEFREYSSAFRTLGWNESIGPNTQTALSQGSKSFEAENDIPIFVVYADSRGPRINYIEFDEERLESEHLAMIGTTSRILIVEPKSKRVETIPYDDIYKITNPSQATSNELSFGLSTNEGHSIKAAITNAPADSESLKMLLDAFLRRISSYSNKSE